jgi:hypothetical protein
MLCSYLALANNAIIKPHDATNCPSQTIAILKHPVRHVHVVFDSRSMLLAHNSVTNTRNIFLRSTMHKATFHAHSCKLVFASGNIVSILRHQRFGPISFYSCDIIAIYTVHRQ